MQYGQGNQFPKSFKEQVALTTINPAFEGRWYQTEAVGSVFNYFYESKGKGHPLVVAPTGAGKSHILGMFCKEVLERWPDQKILILTHVDTIIRQDYLALLEHLPKEKVGIFSAGVGRKERRSVTVAGIQSIYQKSGLFKTTTIILVDEAHMIPPGSEGQYRTFLSAFDCPVVGLTATHFRLKSGYLHEGEGRLFTDICYEVDIERLIEEGYLCNLIPKDPYKHINVEGVKIQGGDFKKSELRERATRDGLTQKIVEELTTYKDKYKHWLVFAIDIDHCEDLYLYLNAAGIYAEQVHSKLTKTHNERIKEEYKAGQIQALVSVEGLTTGFDAPFIDLIALVRPTRSPVLHIQMIGRGLRVHPDKEHCLVLDFAGNVDRLGPINDVHIARKRKKGGGPPITKTCPNCRTICPGATRICPTCGYTFEFESKLETKAGGKDIIKKKKEPPPPAWHDVDRVSYSEYTSHAGNHLMLVSYHCGLRTFFEYKSFNTSQWMGYNTRHWWQNRAYDRSKIPEDPKTAVLMAQANALRAPDKIEVQEGGKYPEILNFYFIPRGY